MGIFRAKISLKKYPCFLLQNACKTRAYRDFTISNYACERFVPRVISQFHPLHKPPRAVFTILTRYVYFILHLSNCSLRPTTPIILIHISKWGHASFRLRDLCTLFTIDVVKGKELNTLFFGSFFEPLCKSTLGENIVVVFWTLAEYGSIVLQ